MMKYKYSCILIFLMCILIGCSDYKTTEELNPDDLQYINNHYSMTDSAFISSMDGIHYKDFMNGTRIYACSQLDCTHMSNSGCMAYPDVKKNEGLFSFPFIYNTKLYYFDTRSDNNILLIRSQLDGSNKEALGEQKLSSLEGNEVLRVGSKLYYWGNWKETDLTEDGYVDLLSVDYEIFEADLETGKIRQLTSFGTYYNYNVNSLIYSDGCLYFSFKVQKRSWTDTPYANPEDRLDVVLNSSPEEVIKLIDMQSMIGRIHISTGDQIINQVDFYHNIVAVTKDRIFIQTEDELLSYDKNWENETIEYVTDKEKEDSGFIVHVLDDQIVLKAWDGFEKPRKYFIWDSAKNKLVDLEFVLDYGISFIDYSKNKLLIAKTPLKASSRSDEWSYVLADKEKFLKGELQYTDVEVNIND